MHVTSYVPQDCKLIPGVRIPSRRELEEQEPLRNPTSWLPTFDILYVFTLSALAHLISAPWMDKYELGGNGIFFRAKKNLYRATSLRRLDPAALGSRFGGKPLIVNLDQIRWTDSPKSAIRRTDSHKSAIRAGFVAEAPEYLEYVILSRKYAKDVLQKLEE
jgi:hypothetical protein